MSNDDEYEIEEVNSYSYEDPIAQRACAFVTVARFADTCADASVKEITLVMLRKINASIKAPSTAELKTFEGGRL